MKKYAVIVAGGSGQRMGTSIPKQFLLLQGKPLLWYSLQVFLQAFDDLQIILVVPGDNLAEGEQLAAHLAQRLLGRARHPAGPARLEDGHGRRRLAHQPQDADPLGPRLHQEPLRHSVRRLERFPAQGLVLSFNSLSMAKGR